MLIPAGFARHNLHPVFYLILEKETEKSSRLEKTTFQFFNFGLVKKCLCSGFLLRLNLL